MPMYDYRCELCGKLHVDVMRPMSQYKRGPVCCGEMAKLQIAVGRPDPWKPIVLEHIADEPMRFETRGQLRRYCREHGLASGALL